MIILILLVSVVLFVLADLGVRKFAKRAEENRKRLEREEALAVSLKLDFTREARSLKRAEVADPAARILCVDDEGVVLDSFRKILVLAGYSVDTVQTGQEALGLVQAGHYDFVFTDLNLKVPEMDGVDVVKAVKHMRPDIDVVIITGYATVETAVECMKFGAMDYVRKPFTEDELLAFVKKTLIKRQDKINRRLKPGVRVTHLSEAGRVRTGEFSIPGGVFISRGHCWAAVSQDGAVKVGLDDFAKKLLGRVDSVEFPKTGAVVKAGQPLFSVRLARRSAQFHAPVGGRVVKINQALSKDCGTLEITPYYKNWICEIEADNLDADAPVLSIGKSAVALFQADLEVFRDLMKAAAKKPGPEDAEGDILYAGQLETLDDVQYERVARELFRR